MRQALRSPCWVRNSGITPSDSEESEGRGLVEWKGCYGCNQKQKAEAIDAEAEKRAAVIERHREGWSKIREMLENGRKAHKSVKNIEDKSVAFEDLKAAKISSETLKLIQEGERKAWGLDLVVDVTKLTDKQLANIAKGKMPV